MIGLRCNSSFVADQWEIDLPSSSKIAAVSDAILTSGSTGSVRVTMRRASPVPSNAAKPLARSGRSRKIAVVESMSRGEGSVARPSVGSGLANVMCGRDRTSTPERFTLTSSCCERPLRSFLSGVIAAT